MYKNIGILGCGTLGLSLAKQLQSKNAFLLQLSNRSTKNVHKEILNCKMQNLVVNNETLCKKSDIIFLGVRPQQFGTIKDLEISEEKIIISLMSAITVNQLKDTFKHKNVTRIMTTIPELNEINLGIAGVFGNDVQVASKLMKLINIEPFIAQKEATIDIFTVLVNLPYLISIGNSTLLLELENYLNNLLDSDNINIQNIFKWGIKAFQYGKPYNLFDPDNLIVSATKEGILAELIKASYTTTSLVKIFKIALNKINTIRIQL